MKRLLFVLLLAAVPMFAESAAERTSKSCWNTQSGCPQWTYDLQSYFPNFLEWLNFTAEIQAVYDKHGIEMPKAKTSPFQYMSYFPTPEKWLAFVYDLVRVYNKYRIKLEEL